jgi:hypothetical protein
MTREERDARARVALDATRAKLADLEAEERAARETADWATAQQRSAERTLLTEAMADLEERMAANQRVRAEAAKLNRPRPAHGPAPMVSAELVLTTQARLMADGKPYGERAVAKALGVSRSAVRYALGKDRAD